MVDWIMSKLNIKADPPDDEEYAGCIRDLIEHEMIRSMENYRQHGDINCLEHSLHVSYNSYLISRRLGLDYRSAARGGLLHDFFLYDWHAAKPYQGLHGFMHPCVAVQNADKYFCLNELEKEIIQKHMWPLTITPPRYKEAYVVVFADKYCAFMEISKLVKKRNLRRLQRLLSN